MTYLERAQRAWFETALDRLNGTTDLEEAA